MEGREQRSEGAAEAERHVRGPREAQRRNGHDAALRLSAAHGPFFPLLLFRRDVLKEELRKDQAWSDAWP